MKIDKTVQKKCISTIKEKAADYGYKKISNTIYKINNNMIFFIDYLMVDSRRLIYRINIKKKSFDYIFWKIMNMKELYNQKESLHVKGAFSSPSVSINHDTIVLQEDLNQFVYMFYNIINEKINEFVNNVNFDEYIFEEFFPDLRILQCLYYFETNQIDKAKEIAGEEIRKGDRGRFVNSGKGFFEWVLLYK